MTGLLLLAGVGDRRNLDVGEPAERLDVGGPDEADSDNAYFNRVHGSLLLA